MLKSLIKMLQRLCMPYHDLESHAICNNIFCLALHQLQKQQLLPSVPPPVVKQQQPPTPGDSSGTLAAKATRNSASLGVMGLPPVSPPHGLPSTSTQIGDAVTGQPQLETNTLQPTSALPPLRVPGGLMLKSVAY